MEFPLGGPASYQEIRRRRLDVRFGDGAGT